MDKSICVLRSAFYIHRSHFLSNLTNKLSRWTCWTKNTLFKPVLENIQQHTKSLAGWHPERQHELGVPVQSVQGWSDILGIDCAYEPSIGKKKCYCRLLGRQVPMDHCCLARSKNKMIFFFFFWKCSCRQPCDRSGLTYKTVIRDQAAQLNKGQVWTSSHCAKWSQDSHVTLVLSFRARVCTVESGGQSFWPNTPRLNSEQGSAGPLVEKQLQQKLRHNEMCTLANCKCRICNIILFLLKMLRVSNSWQCRC